MDGGRTGSDAVSVDRILAGDVRLAARLMRDLDDGAPSAVQALKALYPHAGRATIVGVTGNPGSGKSTLVSGMLRLLRERGRRVAVVAVDPTSPFSGGAILGDRVRMQEHATDPGVFIRSLATRGHMGGLSRSTADVVEVVDAMGYEVVLVETVGVGQDEVEIARAAHTTVVVMVPGLGDEVQAIKAGLLEIADVFAVNKADRPGADKTIRDLEMVVHGAAERSWSPPIVRTVATTGEGVPELWAEVERHLEAQRSGPAGAERERQRAEARLLEILRDRFQALVDGRLREAGTLEEMVGRLVDRSADPYTLAEEAMRALTE
jgi:LAO/AO transport system kinase